jgi:vacuole morphology and inheritance protein 14
MNMCVCMYVQVEGIVKQLAAAGDHDKITSVINLLTNEFTYSPQANHRKVFQSLNS